MKDNFIKGREFGGVEDLGSKYREWVNRTVTPRTHATTGRVLFECLAEEGLLPIEALHGYVPLERGEWTVNQEGYVPFGASRYSLQPQAAGQKVEVESNSRKTTMLKGNTVITEHREAFGKSESVCDPLHAAEMWKLALDREYVQKANPAKLLIQISDEGPLTVYEEVTG